mmetsp:Transcript_107697/g.185710  ORF Transcript_107697/g.185710 Transcript_107697/m.185710 type:complete len:207 (-) Transcript_107697:1173-1793(-)
MLSRLIPGVTIPGAADVRSECRSDFQYFCVSCRENLVRTVCSRWNRTRASAATPLSRRLSLFSSFFRPFCTAVSWPHISRVASTSLRKDSGSRSSRLSNFSRSSFRMCSIRQTRISVQLMSGASMSRASGSGPMVTSDQFSFREANVFTTLSHVPLSPGFGLDLLMEGSVAGPAKLELRTKNVGTLRWSSTIPCWRKGCTAEYPSG